MPPLIQPVGIPIGNLYQVHIRNIEFMHRVAVDCIVLRAEGLNTRINDGIQRISSVADDLDEYRCMQVVQY